MLDWYCLIIPITLYFERLTKKETIAVVVLSFQHDCCYTYLNICCSNLRLSVFTIVILVLFVFVCFSPSPITKWEQTSIPKELEHNLCCSWLRCLMCVPRLPPNMMPIITHTTHTKICDHQYKTFKNNEMGGKHLEWVNLHIFYVTLANWL